jgi:Poly (ADP-ribose) glycohydrolase (PARG)
MTESSHDNLISRMTFETRELISSHPPQFHHPNKIVLNDIANPPGGDHHGRISYSRWRALPLPTTIHATDCRTALEVRKGFYGYVTEGEDTLSVEWYVNFAHHDLFCSYGLGVIGQDEIQVAEHPALASLREALISTKAKPLTVEDGVSTPVLVKGVERRCSIATDRNEEAGRPLGLYGRQFALATPEAIERATTVLNPPTMTNLIAIEAPSFGKGAYTREQLEFILATAFTGFAAAVRESRREGGSEPAVVVHTGFWGCGAYGGNRVVMALLQILAAGVLFAGQRGHGGARCRAANYRRRRSALG